MLDDITKKFMDSERAPVIDIMAEMENLNKVSRKEYSEITKLLFDEAFKLLDFCVQHDGKGYETLRTQLKNELAASCNTIAKLKPILTNHALDVYDIFPKPRAYKDSENIPMDKSEAIALCLQQFDKKNASSKTAYEYMCNGLASAVANLKEKLTPKQEQVVVAAGDKKGEEVPVPKLWIYDRWYDEIVKRELEGNLISQAKLKELINKLNEYFSQQMASTHAKKASMKLNLHLDGFDPNLAGAGHKTIKLVRDGEGSCEYPYWGRVVTVDQARRTNRQLLCDIGNNNDAGPQLYLDGTAYSNPNTSQFCWSWLVTPLPKAKKDDKDSDKDEPKAKRPKAQKAPPVATHKIEYSPLEVTLRDGTKFEYSQPTLEDMPGDSGLLSGVPSYRMRTGLDDFEFKKEGPGSDKAVGSDTFVMM